MAMEYEEGGDGDLIGPAPPELVAEADDAGDDARAQEVVRILRWRSLLPLMFTGDDMRAQEVVRILRWRSLLPLMFTGYNTRAQEVVRILRWRSLLLPLVFTGGGSSVATCCQVGFWCDRECTMASRGLYSLGPGEAACHHQLSRPEGAKIRVCHWYKRGSYRAPHGSEFFKLFQSGMSSICGMDLLAPLVWRQGC